MSERRARVALAVGALAALVAVPAALAGGLHGNPANAPSLLRKPIEDLRYDYGERCRNHPRPGLLALKRWLERHVRGESWSIMRCEVLPSGHHSLHAEGRAIDWRLDARRHKEKRAAERLIKVLLAEDNRGNHAALARRMG